MAVLFLFAVCGSLSLDRSEFGVRALLRSTEQELVSGLSLGRAYLFFLRDFSWHHPDSKLVLLVV
jgi:hypothetical protein